MEAIKKIDEQNDYCIMSQKLATILLAKGFQLHNIAPNKKYIGKSVFYFYYDSEIKNIVDEYMNKNKRENKNNTFL